MHHGGVFQYLKDRHRSVRDEEIEEFEHDSLAQYDGVDFYVDENANVWDENMTFVGKYDEDEDALAIVEGYEPEVDED